MEELIYQFLLVMAGFWAGSLVVVCIHERSGCGKAHESSER